MMACRFTLVGATTSAQSYAKQSRRYEAIMNYGTNSKHPKLTHPQLTLEILKGFV